MHVANNVIIQHYLHIPAFHLSWQLSLVPTNQWGSIILVSLCMLHTPCCQRVFWSSSLLPQDNLISHRAGYIEWRMSKCLVWATVTHFSRNGTSDPIVLSGCTRVAAAVWLSMQTGVLRTEIHLWWIGSTKARKGQMCWKRLSIIDCFLWWVSF